MAKKIRATAEVKLTLVVKTPSSWSAQCPVEQIHEQAGRKAEQLIRSMLTKHTLNASIKLTGESEVTCVTMVTE